MKIIWRIVFVVALLGLLACVAPSSTVRGETGAGFIEVHTVNPEGVEISTIQGVSAYSVAIYDEDTFIGYGPNIWDHPRRIQIAAGAHTIRAKFNGMTKERAITIGPNRTKTIVFTFERTDFDIATWLSTPYHERLERSWTDVGPSPSDFVYGKNSTQAFISHACYYLKAGGTLSASAVLDRNFENGYASTHGEISVYASGTDYCCQYTAAQWNGGSYPIIDSGFPQTGSFDRWYVQKLSGTCEFDMKFSNGATYSLSPNMVSLPANTSSGAFQAACVRTGPVAVSMSGCYIDGWSNGHWAVDGGLYYYGAQSHTCTSVPYDLTGTGIRDQFQGLDFRFLDAQMVSPSELGISMNLSFPSIAPPDASRKVRVWGTVNGVEVEENFDVSDRLGPGETAYIELQEGYAIDLADKGVPRFNDDQRFTLHGVAYWDGGPSSSEDNKEATVLLPVIVIHGYTYTHSAVGKLIIDPLKPIAYTDLMYSLKTAGYTTDDTWYRTLWGLPDCSYEADKLTESAVTSLVNGWVERAFQCSYASKVNLIGHSTGGLVARYYAGQASGWNKVNKIIAIGTPHLGLTLFYQLGFQENSQAEADKLLKVPGTENANLLRWFEPTYFDEFGQPISSLVDYATGDPVPEPYVSTFNPPINPQVQYHSIYADHRPTAYQLKVQKKANGWYEIKDTLYGQGDGRVLSESGKRWFPSEPPIRSGIHQFLCNEPSVRSRVVHILTGDTANSSLGSSSSWFDGTLYPSQSTSYAISVEPGTEQATFSVTWPGSDLDLLLHDPSGRLIDASVADTDPNIDFVGGVDYEQYVLLSPTVGDWVLEVAAVDVSEAGEDYEASVQMSSNVPPIVGEVTVPTAPNAVGTPVYALAEFNDPGVPDTHVAFWDWGDDSWDSWSEGMISEADGSGTVSGSHTYSTTGIYAVMLYVVDDDGEYGVATARVSVEVPATVDFDPDTINLESKGNYVTTCIELPEGYDVAQIDVSSILLNGTVSALAKTTAIGDHDKDGIPDLMVKFDRAVVQKILSVGDQVEITITGKVADLDFRGTDTIRVI